MHARNSCVSCAVTARQQKSSALDSLLCSLEQGMHDGDVVVPVHRYLPSITVVRGPCLRQPVLSEILTLHGVASSGCSGEHGLLAPCSVQRSLEQSCGPCMWAAWLCVGVPMNSALRGYTNTEFSRVWNLNRYISHNTMHAAKSQGFKWGRALEQHMHGACRALLYFHCSLRSWPPPLPHRPNRGCFHLLPPQQSCNVA